MKFRKISFDNHPVLGSVSFDFTDGEGNTVDTIILAGENGCGKSYLLSFLNTYSPAQSTRALGFSMRVEVELSEEDIKLLYDNRDSISSIRSNLSSRVVTFEHSIKDDYVRAEYYTGKTEQVTDHALVFAQNPRLYRSIFSDVEINFTPGWIQYTTSSNLDIDLGGSERSSANLATEITQLLIDINELDNEDLAKWVDAHKGEAPGEEVLHKRIRRFTRAFDQMFPHKHFVGINNIENRKTVLFEEFGKQMEINQLSSGEKQIVFRGGFLLRNLGANIGSIVLVDEPELSLHPKWQLKILGFLKRLFTDDSGKQTSQLIVATHSPFILHNDTRANDKVIVLQKNEKGDIIVRDKPEYYNWSAPTAIEEAFHVTPFLTDKGVIVFLEGETDEAYFNRAMDLFGFDSTNLAFKWIGNFVGNDRSRPENSGDRALNGAAAFFKANPEMMSGKKVYLLYDSDTRKQDVQIGNLYVGAMSKNAQAPVYKIGVENLLELSAGFEYDKFYKTSSKVNEYGAVSTIVNLDKTALVNHIIRLPEDQLSTVLKNIKAEIEKVLKRTGEYCY